jgi:hypothetical protein
MASRKKDQGFIAEMITFVFFYLLCKVLGDGMMDYLYQYDVPREVEKMVGIQGEDAGEKYERECERELRKRWF